jgi:hypothetical protein
MGINDYLVLVLMIFAPPEGNCPVYHEENINKRPYTTLHEPERKETGTRRGSYVCPCKLEGAEPPCVATKYWFGVTHRFHQLITLIGRTFRLIHCRN